MAFFKSCIGTIKLPPQLEIIEDGAFFCADIRNMIIPPDSMLKIIGNNAFENNSFTSINTPSQVTRIGSSCFKHCTVLKNFNFISGSRLKIIGEEAFNECCIENIILPSNLEIIESGSFMKNKLVNIVIPKSVNKIGKSCFDSCKILQSVTFSQGSKLEKIEEKSFANTSLNMISIPPNVKEIEKEAFSMCDTLKIISIDGNSQLKVIDVSSFKDSAKSIEKIISPKLLLVQLFESFMVNLPNKLHLEITDKDEIDLDQFVNIINNVDEISLPNATKVHLDIDCNFTKLNVPHDAVLSGNEIANQKHRIIFCKKQSAGINIMNSEEFDDLYQNDHKKLIGEGSTSKVFKVPHQSIPNIYFALKILKCRIHPNTSSNDNDNDDWTDDDDDDNDTAGNSMNFHQVRYFLGEYEILNGINHPNIIKAYSFFFGDDQREPAILLEYCGHNLE